MSKVSNVLNRRTFCAASATLATTIGFQRLATAADEPASATISQIAKFKINMEKESEAVEALKELCKAVEANEPGVLAYVCHRSTKNPDELVFFEVYKDQDAMNAHAKTAHLGKLRANFVTLFRGPLEVTRLDRIGGFTR